MGTVYYFIWISGFQFRNIKMFCVQEANLVHSAFQEHASLVILTRGFPQYYNSIYSKFCNETVDQETKYGVMRPARAKLMAFGRLIFTPFYKQRN